MSTFSGLNTAYTGLVAARKGLDVVGQNIANANTAGYTRQRVSTAATSAVKGTSFDVGLARPGQGVSITGIARLASMQLDVRVRISAAMAGYSAVRANALTSLESVLSEPGPNGISAQLQEFWAAWADVSNNAGEPAPAGMLLQHAQILAERIASGYTEIEAQWSGIRSDAVAMTTELNTAAAEVADLNAQIRSITRAGGSANELLDRRDSLITTMAAISGATMRTGADGTVDVLIDGNAIVSDDSFRPVTLAGSVQMGGTGVHLEWAHRPGQEIALGGELAGAISLLAPADGSGTGGALAEAANAFNAFAQHLADTVNQVHRTGATTTGATGLDFFGFDAGAPLALGLHLVPTGPGGIAAGRIGEGEFSGAVADAISQLGLGGASPDQLWSSLVTGIGVATRFELQHATLADVAANSAVGAQLAHSGVNLDEENLNLLAFQHAYQGAARVMTAVDEMLDTLINRMGLVGR